MWKWVQMMSCTVSAAGSRLRRVVWPFNLVLCLAESDHKCREPKKHLDNYIRLARDIGFRWFYMWNWVKMMSCRVSAAGSRLRRFVWLSNLVLYIAESGQKCKEPKKHFDYYIRLARDIGFRWFYVKMGKMMPSRVSAAVCRLRRVFWPINLVYCIAKSGHKCKGPK